MATKDKSKRAAESPEDKHLRVWGVPPVRLVKTDTPDPEFPGKFLWRFEAGEASRAVLTAALALTDDRSRTPVRSYDGPPDLARRAEKLRRLRSLACDRLHALYRTHLMGGQSPAYTPEALAVRAAAGVDAREKIDLGPYHENALALADYVDALVADTGLAEPAIWASFGLLPWRQYGTWAPASPTRAAAREADRRMATSLHGPDAERRRREGADYDIEG